MTTVSEQGYQSVMKRALEKYAEVLEMTVDTCRLTGDSKGEREALKEWGRVGLAIKKLGSNTSWHHARRPWRKLLKFRKSPD